MSNYAGHIDYYIRVSAAAIGTTVAGSLIHKLDKFDSTKAVSLVWLSGSLVTDLLIAVALVICLVCTRIMCCIFVNEGCYAN